MIIQASNVAMQGSSSYQRTESSSVEVSRTTTEAHLTSEELEQIGLKPAATLSLNENNKTDGIYSPKKISGTGIGDWENELKSQIIRAFLQSLQNGSDSSQHSGLIENLRKKLRLDDFQDSKQTKDEMSELMGKFKKAQRKENGDQQEAQALNDLAQRFRVITSTNTIRVSRELSIENSMSFSTKAQVKTSDGRTIDIDLQLNMSQSFYEKSDVQSVFSNSMMKDPLVINFNAPSAMLSNTKFEFDIDADGTTDQISRLMSGSGFLAYDKNSDGIVNDGTELFGALSGNGFADLAMYDKDGNHWIDEADDIFNKLRVWIANEDGSHTLLGLGELGVGAIYLGSATTDYAMGDLKEPDGMIRRTGFFLYEDGRAGTAQQIDLKV